jgi:hypothetical protein
LPPEVVEAYYPDRVAVGDDSVINTDNYFAYEEETGNVIQFPNIIRNEES